MTEDEEQETLDKITVELIEPDEFDEEEHLDEQPDGELYITVATEAQMDVMERAVSSAVAAIQKSNTPSPETRRQIRRN